MKRILFVDDEPMILEGLQRMLRPCRTKWEMAFANSGSEALEMLAMLAYDVIVSDMRMPGMDGAELLELVRERYPGVIRIVLSGQFELEATMRAVPVAHQFLTKPCDAGKLQTVLERSCGATSEVGDDAVRRAIAAIGELPALPGTYAALVAAVDAPDTTLDHVSAIVERDVAVAAKVLQLVNSSFFGLSHEIATVSMAVGFLGFDVLKQLVVTVELFRTFECACGVSGFSVEEIQRHSRCVAAIAAQLPVPRRHNAAVSVAALLHDVGKLVLASRLPAQFERALRDSRDQHRPLEALEKEITGTSHEAMGAYLLALWGLPASVVAAVSEHHQAFHATADTEIDISMAVRIADLLEHEVSVDSESFPAGTLDDMCKGSPEMAESVTDWRKVAAEVVQRELQCR
jgi:putative nucleotidyltransferase with HDIG domain